MLRTCAEFPKGGSVLPDRSLTFWTLTTWESNAHMREYMTHGSHRTAMPHLMHWCDEASVVHWDQPGDGVPAWSEADKRMRESGRASKVNHPSPSHASVHYPPPRLAAAAPILPASPRKA
jgi:hypothetical protein